MIMKVEYILERLVSSLLSDYEALSKMTESAENRYSPRNFAMLVNSKNKTARSLLTCLIVNGDPKIKSLSKAAERDISYLLSQVIADSKKQLLTYKFSDNDDFSEKTRSTVEKDMLDSPVEDKVAYHDLIRKAQRRGWARETRGISRRSTTNS